MLVCSKKGIPLVCTLTGRPAPFAASYMVGREDKRTNDRTMFPTLKNNASAGYQGPVKIELFKVAGLLTWTGFRSTFFACCKITAT